MNFRMESQPNVSACQSHQEEPTVNQINEGLFWAVVATAASISIFGAIANSLVMYFAYQEPSTGTLRHLNRVVKHLAVSDILYNVLACPLSLVNWKMGKI